MAALEIDGVSKRYGNVVALSEMTFSVQAGELFGFVGSNGAGKTTTMRIVLGVLAADAGAIRWQGVPIDLRTRGRIGYLPEERGLYPKMKVGDQLIYLARLHGRSRKEARGAATHWTERLGIAGRWNDPVEKLSQGNQQRVQLAAALVHDPEVLVLDEPFAGLDPVAVDVMSAVLTEKAAQGVPVIFSSHQLELVERLCDRVGIVSAGALVAEGTVEELRTGGASCSVRSCRDERAPIRNPSRKRRPGRRSHRGPGVPPRVRRPRPHQVLSDRCARHRAAPGRDTRAARIAGRRGDRTRAGR